MNKWYYKIVKHGYDADEFYWELYTANGWLIASSGRGYHSEGDCLEAINRLEEIVGSKPRCILPKESGE